MPVTVLNSFADAVDENYSPKLDGWDGEPPATRMKPAGRLLSSVGQIRPLLSTVSAQTAATIVVPFPVGVGEGDVSDQVYAVKRAYSRSVSGWRLRQLMGKPLEVRRSWGAQFSDEFGQHSYMQARHTLLAPYFDAYALALLTSAPVMSAREKQITKQIAWHTALYNRRYQMAYSQARPSQLYSADRITRGDCSGSVAGGCAWASVLIPTDWRYTNTWSQVKMGTAVSGHATAKPGDIVFYGSPGHEALYLGGGLIWSFGSYPCRILRYDYRPDILTWRRFVP